VSDQAHDARNPTICSSIGDGIGRAPFNMPFADVALSLKISCQRLPFFARLDSKPSVRAVAIAQAALFEFM